VLFFVAARFAGNLARHSLRAFGSFCFAGGKQEGATRCTIGTHKILKLKKASRQHVVARGSTNARAENLLCTAPRITKARSDANREREQL